MKSFSDESTCSASMDSIKVDFSGHFTLNSSAIANINYILGLPETGDYVTLYISLFLSIGQD